MEFLKDIPLHETPWLAFKEKVFRSKSGDIKHWTYVERKSSSRAVCVIPSAGNGTVGIIVQPRPPAGRVVWEFPAGLVDDKESLGEAAIRELKEETGAEGKIVSISPQVYPTPGLTNETISFVEVEVVRVGEATPEPDEEIELKWLTKSSLLNFLIERSDAGDGIDAKLWLYAMMHR